LIICIEHKIRLKLQIMCRTARRKSVDFMHREVAGKPTNQKNNQ